MDLSTKHCVPCEGSMPPMTEEEVEKYKADVLGWTVAAGAKKIYREFTFSDFKATMAFVNRVAEIAENEGHHPDMQVRYGNVVVELWTHAVGGLSENDFIVAAKINRLV
jgi:4a-hydroxytetrahydrobiopterin dehydratase